ncbi:putative secreted protein [Rosellinia necatrix]|uniref:Putative secreted protein n=1 Tax=Rosellinia necatrix TaxID=77044 RepID=A0A1W2TGN5_ROSNE|nr:putative secreted protein [Rosellinia necatrix]
MAASIPLSVHEGTNEAPVALPHITSLSYSGNGCPSSSPGVERTGAGFGDIGFRLNGFQASLPGIDTSNTNCQVHLQATGCAAGWQVGIQSATIKGHLVLDPGASITWYLMSYWSESAGNTNTISGTVSNSGSSRIDEDITKSANAGAVAWSPCAKGDGFLGILNVNFRVSLDGSGKQYGYFGKNANTATAESWNYVWRQC